MVEDWLFIGFASWRVLLVELPAQGVTQDVFSDGVQFALIPNDVFVIIALPYLIAGSVEGLVDFARADGLEILDDGVQRACYGALRGVGRSIRRQRLNG